VTFAIPFSHTTPLSVLFTDLSTTLYALLAVKRMRDAADAQQAANCHILDLHYKPDLNHRFALPLMQVVIHTV